MSRGSGYAKAMTEPRPHPVADPTRPVAIVTGASRGLGFLLARELADRGYDLIVNARSADALAAAAAGLRSRGVEVVDVAGDIGVEPVAQRVVDTARERFGRLDVLVANAGIIQVGPAEAMRPADYATAMDVMFWGVVHPVLAALPALRERRGRVLVVTSVGGKLPAPHLLPYVAAKHAAVGFAEGLRVEAARDGVSVTVGVPGLMRTGSPATPCSPATELLSTPGSPSPTAFRCSHGRAAAAKRLIAATLRGAPEAILTPAANSAPASTGSPRRPLCGC